MLFLTFFLLIIVVGFPTWDYFYMRKIDLQTVEKWKMYSEIMLVQWTLVIILFIFWYATDRRFSDLFTFSDPFLHFSAETLIYAGLGVLITILIFAFIFRSSSAMKEKMTEALNDENIQFLIPKTKKERILFFLVSITAGVCEEIIFRGLMVYYFSHLPFDLSLLTIGIIASVLFGLVHLYQGWKGVLRTAYIGGILFFLYVGTGTLWVPIALHFLIDVQLVFLPRANNTV